MKLRKRQQEKEKKTKLTDLTSDSGHKTVITPYKKIKINIKFNYQST